MTRVFSGAALILLTVGAVWFTSDRVFAVAGGVLVSVAVRELILLARASEMEISLWPALIPAILTCAIVSTPPGHALMEVALMSALVAHGFVALGSWRGGPNALASVSASLFPALYLGLPIGALVAIRGLGGPRGLFLLMLTVMVSDTAQYYCGRAFGRRPLAPAISPKKTVEGAIGGLVVGTAVFVVAGGWRCRGWRRSFASAWGSPSLRSASPATSSSRCSSGARA